MHIHLLVLIAVVKGLSAYNSPDNVHEKPTVFQFPRIKVEEKDSYICMTASLQNFSDTYLVGFHVDVFQEVAHHVTFAACEDNVPTQRVWDCKKEQGHLCHGKSIPFGDFDRWSQHHGKINFPEDVSVPLGKANKLNSLIVQIHFKDEILDPSTMQSNPANLTLYTTYEGRKNSFQDITLFSTGYIPPKAKGFKADVACIWSKPPAYLYEYSIHTHFKGIWVEGYLIRNNTVTVIANADPQKKRHDISKTAGGPLNILPGDILAARCTYDNSDHQKVIFGPAGTDEMCNLDMNFKFRKEDIQLFERSLRCRGDAQTKNWCPRYDPNNVLCHM